MPNLAAAPRRLSYPARDDGALTQARLRGCLDCGQLQIVPPQAPGSVARCNRCNAELRRVWNDTLTRGLALNLAALGLLVIACTATLLTVSTFGMYRSATVFTGPMGFGQQNVWTLALVVAFMSALAPFLRLVLVSYVLLAFHIQRPPPHLHHAFRVAEKIRPWAMIDVYLLGVFVAVTELPSTVHVEIGLGLYALVVLMVLLVASEALLDRQAVWEALERKGLTDELPLQYAGPESLAGALTCETCGLVSTDERKDELECPRCGSRLEARKANSLSRTWALVIGALVLYVPANTLPVLAFIEMGSGQPHTILGGARELLNAGMWPLALLVFLASIGVPCLKLVSLVLLLVTTQIRTAWQLQQRTILYRFVSTIGRWSMIDIFMESVLIALVQFGAIVTIEPGLGAVAFAGVVILTMIAAETFDPRLMWDAGLGDRRSDVTDE
jgi:paraquat-inducible protein A